jgi:autotransporter-associated beta strand protein
VLEGYTFLTVNASQLAANNPTPATWTLSGNKTLNTNGGDLTVLAPLAGAGGIAKTGDGTLTLTAASTTTGAFTVSGGTLASTVAAGQPFGSGAINVSAGTLALAPAGSGGAVNLTGASGAGATFTYGTTDVQLDRGGHDSLTFTVGGYTDGATANLVQSSRGTLVIAPAGGTGGLGGTERFVVNGTGGNLPAVTNGMVLPSIVARDSGASGNGDFLTYGASGFARAGYTQASAVPINSATPSTVYEANISQTLTPGSTASVYALKVGAVTVNGAGTLQVGPQAFGAQAGLILNGGTVATSTLAFGQSDAMVYTGPVGGTVSAVIQGSGSMVKFGTGALTVTAPSQFTGTTYIQQGTFVAANASGSATGSGLVVVGPAGTLQINTGATAGSAAGTTAQAGGTVHLSGGTLTGPLVMAVGSNLTGSGTVSGSATLNGAITGLTNLNFTGPVTSTGTMTYSWRLNALDANPANAGVSFSQIHFADGAHTILGNAGSSSGFRLNLDLAAGLADPNSSDPF